jgi:hypothetical protein
VVQRKRTVPAEGSHPAGRAPASATADLYMDMAHRGLTALAEQEAASNEPSTATSSGAGSAMPGAVQARMERAFGTDFSSVRVHEGSQAASLGALAYTQGTDIHFAPGQYSPHSQRGAELLGHELAHVVQQSAGRVAATTQARGVSINDAVPLEREADEMGARAARGESVSGSAPQAGGAVQRAPLQMKRGGVIQRAVDTHGGAWDIDKYERVSSGNFRGALADRLRFTPNTNVDATKIGFIQTLKNRRNGARAVVNNEPVLEGRAIPAGSPQEGTYIDRVSDRNNPVYGGEDLTASQTIADSAPQGNTDFGHRYRDSSNAWKAKDATLYDRPRLSNAARDSEQRFETSAIALEGAQKNTYYGSVQWGWKTDGSGDHQLLPLQVVSQGTPTATFMQAADLWNAQGAVGGTPYARMPTEDVQVVTATAGVTLNAGLVGPYRTPLLPAGTRAVVLDANATDPAGNPKIEIRVVDGPHVGANGWIDRGTLRRERSP